MLSPSTPFWGLPCNVPRFWRLRVSRDFTKPEYYIGQTVVYQEVLVDVTGIAWASSDWQYLVELAVYHRQAAKKLELEQWVDSKDLKLP